MADWPYNTANWQKLRKLHLNREPFCRGCKAMGKPYVIANTVDHVVPISEGGPAFPGHDGLASYCPSCHGAKTARGTEAGAVRTSKPRRGCDAEGNPLDAAHSWSEKKGGLTFGKSDGGDTFEDKERTLPKHGKSLRADAVGPTGDRRIELVHKTPGMADRHGR